MSQPSINIFEIIGKTTSRTEPFHSRFLANALQVDLRDRGSLFNGVWKLCAPDCWKAPVKAGIESEYRLDDDRRIDILIEDKENGLAVGIEVKTTSASAEREQLQSYYEGLKKKDFADVAIAYLTPFNKKRGGDFSETLSTSKRFKEFQDRYPDAFARHVSWIEVAEINWDANDLWRQHQHYVLHEIASLDFLASSERRDRSLDEFFGNVIERFWKELLATTGAIADTPVVIDLEKCDADAESLAAVFEILINDDEANLPQASRENSFPKTEQEKFRRTEKYRAFHDALFKLSRKYNHVWLRGLNDYGLCMAHRRYKSSGVSLVRSDGPRRLVVGQLR